MGEPDGRPLGLRLRHAWDEPWLIVSCGLWYSLL